MELFIFLAVTIVCFTIYLIGARSIIKYALENKGAINKYAFDFIDNNKKERSPASIISLLIFFGILCSFSATFLMGINYIVSSEVGFIFIIIIFFVLSSILISIPLIYVKNIRVLANKKQYIFDKIEVLINEKQKIVNLIDSHFRQAIHTDNVISLLKVLSDNTFSNYTELEITRLENSYNKLTVGLSSNEKTQIGQTPKSFLQYKAKLQNEIDDLINQKVQLKANAGSVNLNLLYSKYVK